MGRTLYTIRVANALRRIARRIRMDGRTPHYRSHTETWGGKSLCGVCMERWPCQPERDAKYVREIAAAIEAGAARTPR